MPPNDLSGWAQLIGAYSELIKFNLIQFNIFEILNLKPIQWSHLASEFVRHDSVSLVHIQMLSTRTPTKLHVMGNPLALNSTTIGK